LGDYAGQWEMSGNAYFALDSHWRQPIESSLSGTASMFHLSPVSPMEWEVLSEG